MTVVPEYDARKAYKAQQRLCDECDLPVFVPEDGQCYHCGAFLFRPHLVIRTYSVERAGREYITGCPFCCRSFCG